MIQMRQNTYSHRGDKGAAGLIESVVAIHIRARHVGIADFETEYVGTHKAVITG
jgi:hypothetical protein